MEGPDLLHIGRQSLRGVLALSSRTFFLQLISFGTFFVISTFLSPVEIGIYTAVVAVQRVINFFTDFGLGAALIQKKEALTDEDLKTSFTMQAAITFLIFLLVFFSSNQLASFLNLNSDGEMLLLALVFTIFISSFKTIPSILLERKIQFHKLVIPQIVESLVFNLILVVLVIKGMGVNSYTYAFLISSIVGLPFYYLVSPWKIGIGVDRKSLSHLKFGIAYQGKNVIATIKDDLLTVILVRFLPYAEIGFIGFAQRIAFFVYRYVVDSVTKVTFSSYARIQHDTALLRKAVEKSLFFVSGVMFPLLMGIILVVPYFIDYFSKWNNKWEPAIISIVFFSLNAAVSSLSGILINALDATGHVKKTLQLMIIWTIITWTLTPLLIFKLGYNGVAAASFVTSLTVFYTIYLVKKIVEFSLIKSTYKAVLATMVMGAVITILGTFFITDMVKLFITIAVGGLIYLGVFYVLARQEIREGLILAFKKNDKE